MRTERIAKRRRLRDYLRLAKEKKVKELLHLTFQQAAELGGNIRLGRLHNSVAGLDYGASYYVPPTVEEGGMNEGGTVESSNVVQPDAESVCDPVTPSMEVPRSDPRSDYHYADGQPIITTLGH